MSWVLVFLLMTSGPIHTQRVVMPDDRPHTFVTEQECRDAQQAVLWDEKFVSTKMFGKEYIVVPICLEIETVRVPRKP